MKGKKTIAIVSEAASLGISLQSAKSCQNQKQRVHIVLQVSTVPPSTLQPIILPDIRITASVGSR